MAPRWHCPIPDCRRPFQAGPDVDLDSVAEALHRHLADDHTPEQVIAAAMSHQATASAPADRPGDPRRPKGRTMAPHHDEASELVETRRAALSAAVAELEQGDGDGDGDPCSYLIRVRRLRILLGDVEDAAVGQCRARGVRWSAIAEVLSLSVRDVRSRYAAAFPSSSPTVAISSRAASR